MATTRVEVTANGSTDTFNFNFPYISKGHVRVYLGGVAQTGYTFPTPGSVKLASVPPSGTVVVIQRETPTGVSLTEYQTGVTLTTQDLTTDSLQARYLIEEEADRSALAVSLALADATAQVAAEAAARDAADDAVALSASVALSAETNARTSAVTAANIARAAGDADLNARKIDRDDIPAYLVEIGDAAAQVAFQPEGTGAVSRTVAAKLREVVSVKDFGATGDGETDDTVAIVAAIVAAGEGGTLYFPKGVYIVSDHDADNMALRQLSGQRWHGAGPNASIIRLNAATTDISAVILTENNSVDYSIEDMQIDGNRQNITPGAAVDLYSRFYLVWGPAGGKRGKYRNLMLANSWGRSLQTGRESEVAYTEDVTVQDVVVHNGGTKAISVTKSKRVSVSGCFVEVDAYTAAENPAGVAAGSGSCFECNDSQVVTFSNCHGVQVDAVQSSPGFRTVNSSSNVRVIGCSIEDASYLGLVINCDDIEFSGNTARNLRGNGFGIVDTDDAPSLSKSARVRIHDNTIIDPTGAYVTVTANRAASDNYVEVYIHDNDFVKIAGTPTHGIYNNGVVAPATGGSCLVYQWGNTFTGGVPNELSGAAAFEIRTQPKSGWQVLGQSSVAASHTGSTSEANLAIIPVPAGSLGRNGRLRITSHWSYPNSANNKITRVRFGGLQMASATNTTTAQQRQQVEVCNRNSAGSQLVSVPGNTSGFGTSVTEVLVQSVDTAADQVVAITVQLANATETATLESYLVEVLYAP